MSTWNHLTCDRTGPNRGIYYASVILNVLIIYAVIRVWFIYVTNRVIISYNRALSSDGASSRWILKIWIDALDCKPDPISAPYIFLACLGVYIGMLLVAMVLLSHQRIDGSAYIWYLLCGALTAWLFECCYKTAFYPSTMIKSQSKEAPLTTVFGDKGSIIPKALRWIVSAAVYDNGDDLCSSSLEKQLGFESSLVWRFLPDCLFVVCGVIIAAVGRLSESTISSIFHWIIMPIISSAFIVVSLLQRGESRYNISRVLLETPFMNAVGKASFFMYTLQSAAFNFYSRVVLDDIATKSFPIVSNKKSLYVTEMWSFLWYRSLPLGNKVAGFLCLLAICWLLQTYYQDYFVASMAEWLISTGKKQHVKKRGIQGTSQ